MFTSATLSLAALERFVHTDSDLEPADLLAIPVEFRDDVAIDAVKVETLPVDWRAFPAPPRLAAIGEEWFRASTTPVLSVPSVVIPHERNFVLNPTHRDFSQIVIGPSEPFSFDPTMWKIRGIVPERDIDWLRGTVHVIGKFRKERDVPMQPDVRAALEEQLEDERYEALSSRECVISRPVTGRTADASTVATAAVWPSSAMNSTSKAMPSAWT